MVALSLTCGNFYRIESCATEVVPLPVVRHKSNCTCASTVQLTVREHVPDGKAFGSQTVSGAIKRSAGTVVMATDMGKNCSAKVTSVQIIQNSAIGPP